MGFVGKAWAETPEGIARNAETMNASISAFIGQVYRDGIVSASIPWAWLGWSQ